MRTLLALCLLVGAVGQSPFPSVPTELPSQPFFIKKTLVIGGKGDWNYLAMDAAAHRLFIAHSRTVQVVDVEGGNLVGEIKGFAQAFAVALDTVGQAGYVSDGRAGDVKVFDRRMLEVTASIPLSAPPRSLAFEPQSGLLVVAGPIPPPSPARAPRIPSDFPCGASNVYPYTPAPESLITVLDPEKRLTLAEIQVCGSLGAVQRDGDGAVFIVNQSLNAVLRLDVRPLAALPPKSPLHLDWRGQHFPRTQQDSVAAPGMRVFDLNGACRAPRGLAVDAAHQRLFTACEDMKMIVLNLGTGNVLASLPVGYGTDEVAYDAGRGLIYVANGGNGGSLTVIRQHVTDTYSVIQNLPTLPEARTLAVDPSTGMVYLVTALSGARAGTPPFNGIGTLKMEHIDDSFRVLAIGN